MFTVGLHPAPIETPTSSGAEGAALLARFDRLPYWPYGRGVLVLIGAGYFFGFFDILTIGVALPAVTTQFGVSTAAASVAVTTSLVGYVVGAFVLGMAADRFGRRFGLYASLACFTIGSLLSALSPSMVFLDIARFVTGIGIGAEIAVASTYIGELAPGVIRGRVAARMSLVANTGVFLVPLIGQFLVPAFDGGWRVLFAIGALGGVVTLVLRLRWTMPVTIHRMISVNQLAQAEQLIATAECAAEDRAGGPLPRPVPIAEAPPATRSVLSTLLSAPYLGRVLLLTTVWFIFYLGDYGWLTLAPTLLVDKGFGVGQSLTIVTVASSGLIVGSLLGLVVNDRFERKFTASIALGVWALTMAGIGLFPSKGAVMAFGFVSYLVLGMVIFLMYIYTAENFPTRCRSTGVAITDGLGHIGGALAPLLVLGAYAGAGFTAAFVAMAACGVVSSLLLLLGVRSNRVNPR